MNNLLVIILLIVSCISSSCIKEKKDAENNEFPLLSGPYMGQKTPGNEPELFAPGTVSTAMYTRDIAMTPDGKEIYFCVSALGYNLIFYTKIVDGYWTEPEPAPFITKFNYMFYEPHITPDGKKLMFLSDMPLEKGGDQNENIWVVDRLNDKWGKPYNLGAPINTDGAEFFPSTTRDGTLYFTRQPKSDQINYIYRSRLINGNYSIPEKLPAQVNCGTNRYNAFIDPDERFIIVPAVGMKDGFGGTDYYIVFRDENDNWSEPINLGGKVNQARGREWSPYISPDGKYFFFMSSRTLSVNDLSIYKPNFRELQKLFCKPGNGNSDIFWMKSDFLFDLKK